MAAPFRTLLLLSLVLCPPRLAVDSILIRNGTVVDGTGAKPRRADVRIEGDRIGALGKLKPRKGERVIDASGLVVAPGFIDTHSHAPLTNGAKLDLILTQGITTVVVGQDGGHDFPLSAAVEKVRKNPPPYNVASFVGHGTVRKQVLGEDFKRAATPEEVARMADLIEKELAAGGLGLSSGLEYDPGYFAKTEELIACARAAGRRGGIYISHMRNEDNRAFEALDELIRIAREAGCPAQVSHIKLGSRSVWGRAGEMLRRIEAAGDQGVEVTADVYPYLYWKSSITVLIPTREWSDRLAWQKGLDDVGGPQNVRLTTYSPNRSWEGRTIAQISGMTGKDPVTVIQDVVKNTRGPGAEGKESVVVTAMVEKDLRAFLRDPRVMICTDGQPGGSHPRGAGAYPRILGRYVREQKVLALAEAVRKMTSLPAKRMGFADRGRIRPGLKADIVVFNAETIADRATISNPALPSVGVSYLLVNGRAILWRGTPTRATPGQFLKRAASR